MQDRKIFWMEDYPNIRAITDISKLSKKKVNRKTLLDCVTFAHDVKTAKEILGTKKDFDLYILDGDLPYEIPEKILHDTKSFLRKLRQEKRGELSFPDYREHGIDQFWNAFKYVYFNFLEGENVVIHSVSSAALESAFMLGLPFYYKEVLEDPKEEARKFLQRKENRWHNEVACSPIKGDFDLIYEFIKNNPRWEQLKEKGLEKFYRLKKELPLVEKWECGKSEELVKNRLAPLFH